jgi:glycosyltransferase involved in cell wall biosynthesis
MKISVVICAYNEEQYLANCLQSVTGQMEKPHEVILVNNNSTDGTRVIAERFEVKIIDEPKKGLIAARNTGFSAAKGDIIARCDADTIVPPDWVEKIRINFEQREIDGLSGPVQFYDLHSSTTYMVKMYLNTMHILQQDHHTMVGPNMMLTKSIWNKVKDNVCLDDTEVHEDIDLAIHIKKAGGEIFIDNDLVVQSSARRIKNKPVSFFSEYPLRALKTLRKYGYLKPL